MSDKTVQKRTNYASYLAITWVKTHRPDVFQVCKDEALKKFPRPSQYILEGRGRGKLALKLPITLKNLK